MCSISHPGSSLFCSHSECHFVALHHILSSLMAVPHQPLQRLLVWKPLSGWGWDASLQGLQSISACFPGLLFVSSVPWVLYFPLSVHLSCYFDQACYLLNLCRIFDKYFEFFSELGSSVSVENPQYLSSHNTAHTPRIKSCSSFISLNPFTFLMHQSPHVVRFGFC